MGGTHQKQQSRKGKGGMGSEAAHQGGRGILGSNSEMLKGLTVSQKKAIRRLDDPSQKAQAVAKYKTENAQGTSQEQQQKQESGKKKGKKGKKGMKMG